MEIFIATLMALTAGSIWDEVVEPDQPPPELHDIIVSKEPVFVPTDPLPPPPILDEEKEEGLEKNDEDAFWPPDMIPHPTVPGDGPSGPGEPEFA